MAAAPKRTAEEWKIVSAAAKKRSDEEWQWHRNTKALIPTAVGDHEDFLSKEGRVIVAVERHDHDAERWTSQGPEHRYLWVKARTKFPLSKVREAYINQYQGLDPESTQNMVVGLYDRCGAGPLHDDLPLGAVMHDNELFACRAVVRNPSTFAQETDLSMRHTRPATQPPGNRLSPRRMPLQPVNRQLSLPPKRSESDSGSEDTNSKQWKNLQTSDFDRRLLSDSGPKLQEPGITQISQQPNATPIPFDLNRLRAFLGAKELAAQQSQAATSAEMPFVKSETNDTEHSAPLNAPTPGPSSKPVATAADEYAPREYDNPFATKVEDDLEPAKVHGQSLRELAQDATPERLEAGVQAGLSTLAQLQASLEECGQSGDVQNWLAQVETIRKEAVKTRTVVGVVGNTGAGKSSVINAMLDEERLVPTNCMRACTAVVTELSYNFSNSERSRYRAEIVFIKPEEWEKELKVLVNEVFDEDGHLVGDARNNPDSEAGIAYAKIRAVYHTYTKEMLAKANVRQLMNVERVKAILGSTKSFVQARPEPFYKKLQQYVDSKEKGTEKLDKNGNKITNPKRVFECWPLIKVVKIYTKAEALSTGAVIVDLPGVHDSNAARAAVAEGYMKQCSGLWIVAPITRAVDDKAAKSLLGDTFKRQLKYDGTYSAVTFICSKTDDISRTEAADTLQIPEVQSIEEELIQLRRQSKELATQVKDVKAQKGDYAAAVEEIENQLEAWDDLEDKLEAGETVYAPSFTSAKKRKRVESSPEGKKRRRTNAAASDEDDLDYVELVSDAEDQSANDLDAIGEPLTEEAISTKIDELKGLKKAARRRRTELDQQLASLAKEINDIDDKEYNLDARQSELCIAGRNEYSKSAIQQDFAAGIRELDQENAEEENPDTFDPDETLRDYDEVARSLPVFCVSSRAYQRLAGRFQRDNEVVGFTRLEQTEIPQLQTHCKALTAQGRIAGCRRWLHSLQALLNSLGLWASDDGSGPQLNGQQRDAEKVFLKRKLKDLEKALGTAVKDTLCDITDTLDHLLFDKFEPAIATASSSAVSTANKWGAHRNAGGLHWSTYKATVRRQGVYCGVSGPQDFNNALFEPISKQLATGWEKTFQRRVPTILQNFTKAGSKLLLQFHKAVEARCMESGHAIARIGMLAHSLNSYQTLLTDLATQVGTRVNEGQREINREFVPVVVACMDPAYDMCVNERGPGSFKRMKEHMLNHVEQGKATMFDTACKKVQTSLETLLETLHAQMTGQIDIVCANVQRDYMSTVGGVATGAGLDRAMPREKRAVRKNVDDAITASDMVFQQLTESSVEDLKIEETDPEGIEIDAEAFEEPEDLEDESGADEMSGDEQAGKAAVTADDE